MYDYADLSIMDILPGLLFLLAIGAIAVSFIGFRLFIVILLIIFGFNI